jgi:hypothetical protein
MAIDWQGGWNGGIDGKFAPSSFDRILQFPSRAGWRLTRPGLFSCGNLGGRHPAVYPHCANS